MYVRHRSGQYADCTSALATLAGFPRRTSGIPGARRASGLDLTGVETCYPLLRWHETLNAKG